MGHRIRQKRTNSKNCEGVNMRILALCLFLWGCGADDRPVKNLVEAVCSDVNMNPQDCNQIKKELK